MVEFDQCWQGDLKCDRFLNNIAGQQGSMILNKKYYPLLPATDNVQEKDDAVAKTMLL